MAAELKIKMTESMVQGEVPVYSLTLTVTNATEIDPNIFVVECTRPNLNLRHINEEFHHVAYLYDISNIGTSLESKTHQFVRKSSITRTYLSIERLNESKDVMLADISSLLKAYNLLGTENKESELTVTESGYSSVILNDNTYTFNGETINF
jgi:hypothetical protein